MLQKLVLIFGSLLGIYFIWKGYELLKVLPDGDGVGITIFGIFEYLVLNSNLSSTGITFIIAGITVLILTIFFIFKRKLTVA